MKRIALFSVIFATAGIFLALLFHGRAEEMAKVYDSDPAHVWDRLYATLFIRTGPDGREYGADSLDPPYWSTTRHLLEGDSQKEALRVLDEFLDKHEERLFREPMKRAILQRDLWALFDWAAGRNSFEQVPVDEPGVSALTERLAKVIRRVALTKEQIETLPDNYADAAAAKVFPGAFDSAQPDRSFLPPDLFSKDGPWVSVEMQRNPLPAPVHTQQFGGRSVFLIFISLPTGRDETLAYLQKLKAFPEPWIFDRARLEELQKAQPEELAMPHGFNREMGPWVNPNLPQFPDGTKFALVRQALLIDSEGKLTPTHLTESVQLRVYQTIDPVRSDENKQAVCVFELSRKAFLAGKAGSLRAVEKGEKEFTVFLSMGIDPFEYNYKPRDGRLDAELPDKLVSCTGCHLGAGIQSVDSHSQIFSQPTLPPPQYELSSPGHLEEVTANWKQGQFSWGLLKGLWQREN
jgi:hypothetical protein